MQGWEHQRHLSEPLEKVMGLGLLPKESLPSHISYVNAVCSWHRQLPTCRITRHAPVPQKPHPSSPDSPIPEPCPSITSITALTHEHWWEKAQRLVRGMPGARGHLSGAHFLLGKEIFYVHPETHSPNQNWPKVWDENRALISHRTSLYIHPLESLS